MSNWQKGYARDRQVLEALADWGTMDTEQIKYMFFPSARVAQRRLKILCTKGKIKRFRDAIELPYSYYLKNYDYVRLQINWVRIWFLSRLKSWEVIEEFLYETNTCVIRNTVTNALKTYNIFYKLTRQAWVSDNTIVLYDTEKQRREAMKTIKGTLLTIEEIREEIK